MKRLALGLGSLIAAGMVAAQEIEPRYLTLDVQHAEQELRRTEKQSLFDRR